MWLSVEMGVLMADLTVQLQYLSATYWRICCGARGHQCMMGLSKSMVGVVGENGRPDWSMEMVDGGDVGC